MIYQRLNSLSKQIQTIFGIKIGNNVTGHEGSVVLSRCSEPFRECSTFLTGKSLTPLHVGPRFRLKAGDLEQLREGSEFHVTEFARRVN